jgi:hypothetical protein
MNVPRDYVLGDGLQKFQAPSSKSQTLLKANPKQTPPGRPWKLWFFRLRFVL